MTNFFQINVDTSFASAVFLQVMSNLDPGSIGVWLQDVADPYVRERIQDRFTNEGDDVVGAWSPLSPATDSIRASKGFPPAHPINVRTGYMRGFLVGTDGDVAVLPGGAQLTNPGNGAGPLTQQKIAAAQGGKSYPRTPPRPVLGLNAADALFIHAGLTKHILSGI